MSDLLSYSDSGSLCSWLPPPILELAESQSLNSYSCQIRLTLTYKIRSCCGGRMGGQESLVWLDCVDLISFCKPGQKPCLPSFPLLWKPEDRLAKTAPPSSKGKNKTYNTSRTVLCRKRVGAIPVKIASLRGPIQYYCSLQRKWVSVAGLLAPGGGEPSREDTGMKG